MDGLKELHLRVDPLCKRNEAGGNSSHLKKESIVLQRKTRVCSCVCAQSCPSLFAPMDCSQPARLLCPWNFPGTNTGVGCHFLFEGIFLTQGLKLASLASSSLAGGSFTTEPPGKLLQREILTVIKRFDFCLGISHLGDLDSTREHRGGIELGRDSKETTRKQIGKQSISDVNWS